MKRKSKELALAISAVLAMSALAAPAAPAAEFHSAASPNPLTGSQTTAHVISTTSGTITCKTVTFTGTMNSTTTTTVAVTPNYDNCTAFGFIGVPIHENGCGFILNASGTSEITCPAGKEIEATVPGCTTTIGPQHIPTGKTFTIEISGGKISIISHTNIGGRKYRECGGALQEGGTYKGSTTMTGASSISWT